MKRFLLLLLTAAMLFSMAAPALAVDISAHSAVLIDADSKQILYSKDCDTRLPMASTTKIMTALVAIENADISSTVCVSDKAVGVEGSSVCLKGGEELTLEELLYAMLLESANDAAAAIAIAVGGSIEGFADMMNSKARELGLKNTSFSNPHGLDNENHYTTARELAVIAAEALDNETFLKIVSTYKHKIPYADNGYRYLMNHNKMLRLYDGAIGVKTGFTKKSGRCLVSAAERDGLRLVAVTLNAPDDWRDHTHMLDFGFENYEMREIAGAGEFRFTLSCVGAENGIVTVSNKEAVRRCMRKTDPPCEAQILLPRFVYAPVAEGDRLGEIILSNGSDRIAVLQLTANTTAKVQKYKKGLFGF